MEALAAWAPPKYWRFVSTPLLRRAHRALDDLYTALREAAEYVGPPGLCGKTYVNVVTYEEIAAYMGVKPSTLRRARFDYRGLPEAQVFPDPDLTLGRTPLWYAETIQQWLAERPRRVQKGA